MANKDNNPSEKENQELTTEEKAEQEAEPTDETKAEEPVEPLAETKAEEKDEEKVALKAVLKESKVQRAMMLGLGVFFVAVAVVIVAVLVFQIAGGSAADTELTADTEQETVSEDEGEAADAELYTINDDGTITYDGKTYQQRDDISTILAMGIDDDELTESETYRNNSQADFLLVAVFDHTNETCTLLQIDRDTMTAVPVLGVLGDYIGLTTEQIALAHTYGSGLEDSCENTVEAVSRLLFGVQIDNYCALTMNAIFVLNDLVGGVTVTIEDDFSDVDSTLVMGETVTLTGIHAENYVRARIAMQEGNKTNISRMSRQRTYLMALAGQLKDTVFEHPGFVMKAYRAMKDYLVTDCGIWKAFNYARRVVGYTVMDIVVPEGESVEGEEFMEFYVDEEALLQQVLDLCYAPVEE